MIRRYNQWLLENNMDRFRQVYKTIILKYWYK